ncbi:hypothetical protein IE53DRAFT_387835 [Violaceomyces palustris]|uniref:Uncharacterized protein n=1 Tax=Violaceomyces palustris TaxID=1673888 RepID=A0ACD0NVP6_9BASI|nr:hypothetical protein IE53DRAFT_387835 [Violaceomyces palustris]
MNPFTDHSSSHTRNTPNRNRSQIQSSHLRSHTTSPHRATTTADNQIPRSTSFNPSSNPLSTAPQASLLAPSPLKPRASAPSVGSPSPFLTPSASSSSLLFPPNRLTTDFTNAPSLPSPRRPRGSAAASLRRVTSSSTLNSIKTTASTRSRRNVDLSGFRNPAEDLVSRSRIEIGKSRQVIHAEQTSASELSKPSTSAGIISLPSSEEISSTKSQAPRRPPSSSITATPSSTAAPRPSNHENHLVPHTSSTPCTSGGALPRQRPQQQAYPNPLASQRRNSQIGPIPAPVPTRSAPLNSARPRLRPSPSTENDFRISRVLGASPSSYSSSGRSSQDSGAEKRPNQNTVKAEEEEEPLDVSAATLRPKRPSHSAGSKGLTRDDSIMSKRRFEEAASNDSASMQRPTLLEPPSPSPLPRARPSGDQAAQRAASRRRTWFGFGSGNGDAEDSAPFQESKPSDSAAPYLGPGIAPGARPRPRPPRTSAIIESDAMDLDNDEPPPPMNEDEAAFRRSLGIDLSSFSPQRSSSRATVMPRSALKSRQDAEGDVVMDDGTNIGAESGESQEGGSTIRQNKQRMLAASRRVSWLPWRNEPTKFEPAADQGSEEGERKSDPRSEASPQESKPESGKGDQGPKLGPLISTGEHEEKRGSNEHLSPPNHKNSVKKVRRKTWLAREYEVVEESSDPAPLSQPSFSSSASAPLSVPTPEMDLQKAQGEEVDEGTIKASALTKGTAPGPPSTPSLAPPPSSTLTSSTSASSLGAPFSLRSIWSRSSVVPQVEDQQLQRQQQRPLDEQIPTTAQQAIEVKASSQQVSKPALAQPLPVSPPSVKSQEAASVNEGSWRGTWGWSLWSTSRNPSIAEKASAPDAADPDSGVAIDSQSQPDSHQVASSATLDGATERIKDGTRIVGTSEEGDYSWTYSSYLARWIPTWAYWAQKEEIGSQAGEGVGEGVGGAEVCVNTQEGPAKATTDMARTPAEQVKADALARATTSAPSSASSLVDPNTAVLNSATRSSWVSYFSSRTASRARTISNWQQDENEVMDISDYVQAENSRSGITGSTTPLPKRNVAKSSSASVAANSLSAATIEPGRPTNLSSGSSTPKDSGSTPIGKAAILKAATANASVRGVNGQAKGKTESEQASGKSASKPSSVTSSTKGGGSLPGSPKPQSPNLVLPSFEDTFTRPPRVWMPKVGVLERTLSVVNSYLFSKVPDMERMKRPTRFGSILAESSSSKTGDRSRTGATHRLGGGGGSTIQSRVGKVGRGASKLKSKAIEEGLKEVSRSAQRLPRSFEVMGDRERSRSRGCANVGKVVVVGIHGWFSQSIFKNMLGEPTGTSIKFATMQAESVRRHFKESGMELNPEAITIIPLQGDGKVADRVDKLFAELLGKQEWVRALARADAIFFSAHSQGSVVATQLLARLIEQGQVSASKSRICLLGMCGIHHGPFTHLKSSITSSYINYFETAAAKELFDFQCSSHEVSKRLTSSLKTCLESGVKVVYVGSTDDNVVPLYSALNSSASHPSILRALYIDGQAFPKVDFLTNLLVLCVAVRNAGLSDHNLLTLLSASVAGSLYGGLGHSMVYEERSVYDLATRYLLEVTHPLAEPTLVTKSGGGKEEEKRQEEEDEEEVHVRFRTESFQAQRWNPYELPWSLRGLFEDPKVQSIFERDLRRLLADYSKWSPNANNKALKDLKWRLEPMRNIRRDFVGHEEEEEEGEEGEEERGVGGREPSSSSSANLAGLGLKTVQETKTGKRNERSSEVVVTDPNKVGIKGGGGSKL